MHRYLATWLCAPALWLSCHISANAAPPPPPPNEEDAPLPQPLEKAAARVAKVSRPDNCLAAWPAKQTLQGKLIGIVMGALPPPHVEYYLYLLLDHPIAVCAAPEALYPAYEEVTRIKIRNLSESDFLRVMHRWGAAEVWITSTLNTAQNIHQGPGPVIFDPFDIQFCWLSPSNGKKSDWSCMQY